MFDRDSLLQSKLSTAIFIWCDVTDYVSIEWKKIRKSINHVDEVTTTRLRHGVEQRWGSHPIGPFLQEIDALSRPFRRWHCSLKKAFRPLLPDLGGCHIFF